MISKRNSKKFDRSPFNFHSLLPLSFLVSLCVFPFPSPSLPLTALFKVPLNQAGRAPIEPRDPRPLLPPACHELVPNLSSECLAKLDAPLVEAVDAPDETLHRGSVLVNGEDLTDGKGVEFCHKYRGARPAMKGLWVRQRAKRQVQGD